MVHYQYSRLLLIAVLLCGLLVSVSSCGFHLRGSLGEVSLPATYLQGNPGHPVIQDMRQALLNTKTVIVDDPAAAGLVFVFVNERRDRRAVSINTTGKIQEYQLHYMVTFEVRDAHGEQLLAEQSISATRDFSFVDTDVLAKGSEEESLYRDMRRDAVRAILRRLQSVSVEQSAGNAAVEPPLASDPEGKIDDAH